LQHDAGSDSEDDFYLKTALEFRTGQPAGPVWFFYGSNQQTYQYFEVS
jgi:hypothetical protein